MSNELYERYYDATKEVERAEEAIKEAYRELEEAHAVVKEKRRNANEASAILRAALDELHDIKLEIENPRND